MIHATFSVCRKDVYTANCEHDTTLYEVQTVYDNEYLQDLQLESAEDLIRLRDTLTAYINEHLNTTEHDRQEF